jgi:hypothetical protein
MRNPSPIGQAVTFTAKVTGAVATCTTSGLSAGAYRITVTVLSRVAQSKPVTTTKTFTIATPARKHRK